MVSNVRSSLTGGSSGFSTCGRTLTLLEENNQLATKREGEIKFLFLASFCMSSLRINTNGNEVLFLKVVAEQPEMKMEATG